MTESDNSVWLPCACGWIEHQLRASIIDIDATESEFAIEIHLVTWRRFWGRLWDGLRYAFGHKSKYGNFDEILLGREDVKRLRDLCDVFLKGGKA